MEQLETDIRLVHIYRSLNSCKYGSALRKLDDLLCDVPDHGIAHGIKAKLCAWLLDDPVRARLHYDYAIRFAPDKPEHYHWLTELLEEMGDAPALREVLAKAGERTCVHRAPIALALARTLERRCMLSEALVEFRQSLTLAMEEGEESNARDGIERIQRKLAIGHWAVVSRT